MSRYYASYDAAVVSDDTDSDEERERLRRHEQRMQACGYGLSNGNNSASAGGSSSNNAASSISAAAAPDAATEGAPKGSILDRSDDSDVPEPPVRTRGGGRGDSLSAEPTRGASSSGTGTAAPSPARPTQLYRHDGDEKGGEEDAPSPLAVRREDSAIPSIMDIGSANSSRSAAFGPTSPLMAGKEGESLVPAPIIGGVGSPSGGPSRASSYRHIDLTKYRLPSGSDDSDSDSEDREKAKKQQSGTAEGRAVNESLNDTVASNSSAGRAPERLGSSYRDQFEAMLKARAAARAAEDEADPAAAAAREREREERERSRAELSASDASRRSSSSRYAPQSAAYQAKLEALLEARGLGASRTSNVGSPTGTRPTASSAAVGVRQTFSGSSTSNNGESANIRTASVTGAGAGEQSPTGVSREGSTYRERLDAIMGESTGSRRRSSDATAPPQAALIETLNADNTNNAAVNRSANETTSTVGGVQQQRWGGGGGSASATNPQHQREDPLGCTTDSVIPYFDTSYTFRELPNSSNSTVVGAASLTGVVSQQQHQEVTAAGGAAADSTDARVVSKTTFYPNDTMGSPVFHTATGSTATADATTDFYSMQESLKHTTAPPPPAASSSNPPQQAAPRQSLASIIAASVGGARPLTAAALQANTTKSNAEEAANSSAAPFNVRTPTASYSATNLNNTSADHDGDAGKRKDQFPAISAATPPSAADDGSGDIAPGSFNSPHRAGSLGNLRGHGSAPLNSGVVSDMDVVSEATADSLHATVNFYQLNETVGGGYTAAALAYGEGGGANNTGGGDGGLLGANSGGIATHDTSAEECGETLNFYHISSLNGTARPVECVSPSYDELRGGGRGGDGSDGAIGGALPGSASASVRGTTTATSRGASAVRGVSGEPSSSRALSHTNAAHHGSDEFVVPSEGRQRSDDPHRRPSNINLEHPEAADEEAYGDGDGEEANQPPRSSREIRAAVAAVAPFTASASAYGSRHDSAVSGGLRSSSRRSTTYRSTSPYNNRNTTANSSRSRSPYQQHGAAHMGRATALAPTLEPTPEEIAAYSPQQRAAARSQQRMYHDPRIDAASKSRSPLRTSANGDGLTAEQKAAKVAADREARFEYIVAERRRQELIEREKAKERSAEAAAARIHANKPMRFTATTTSNNATYASAAEAAEAIRRQREELLAAKAAAASAPSARVALEEKKAREAAQFEVTQPPMRYSDPSAAELAEPSEIQRAHQRKALVRMVSNTDNDVPTFLRTTTSSRVHEAAALERRKRMGNIMLSEDEYNEALRQERLKARRAQQAEDYNPYSDASKAQAAAASALFSKTTTAQKARNEQTRREAQERAEAAAIAAAGPSSAAVISKRQLLPGGKCVVSDRLLRETSSASAKKTDIVSFLESANIRHSSAASSPMATGRGGYGGGGYGGLSVPLSRASSIATAAGRDRDALGHSGSVSQIADSDRHNTSSGNTPNASPAPEQPLGGTATHSESLSSATSPNGGGAGGPVVKMTAAAAKRAEAARLRLEEERRQQAIEDRKKAKQQKRPEQLLSFERLQSILNGGSGAKRF